MDSHSEDRNNASHWRELVECERSGTGEQSALGEQMAYNLRPRKDDSVKLQQRLEFTRRKKQQNQRRIEQKEAETRQKKLRERAKMISRIKEMVNRMPSKPEPDFENRNEILNTDVSGIMDMQKWHPYFELPRLGLLKGTLKGSRWAVEELALQIAPSVVGLQSVTDGNVLHFACSGTIVESSGELHKIVTVANLVKKCPDKDELAIGLTFNVYLRNHETCGGHLLYHDFFYNICMIEIQYPLHLPKQGFTSNIEAINFDKSWSRDVVTLGRQWETHGLVVGIGKIIQKCSSFECEELLVSTCRISKKLGVH